MKRILVLAALLPTMLFAQNGIKFEQGKTWAQLKAAAKKSNKLIFLDAYASWCGPCKAMARDVFTQQSVGEYFNATFINAKIDMEVGEGTTIASTYQVAAYPTLFFIDGDGNLVHKVLGYKDVDQLMQSGRNALNPDKQYSTLWNQYQQNKLPEAKYANLAEALDEAGETEKGAELVSKMLAKNKNWLQEPQLGLVYKFTQSANGEQFQFLVQNEAKIAQIAGYEGISDKLNELATATVIQEALDNNTQTLDEAKAKRLFQQLRPSKSGVVFSRLMWRYADFKKEDAVWINAAKAINEVKSDLDWQFLNEVAWKIYDELRSNKALLKDGLSLGLESIKKESNYYNNDTVAHLYAELGQKAEAKTYAKKAIALGKKTGDDVSSTETLLNSL